MKKCPYCAEEIQCEAIKCKHCGEWLSDNQQNSPDEDPKKHRETINEETMICDTCRVEYSSEYFIDGSPICKNCTEDNIKSEEIITQVTPSELPIHELSKKYVKGMIGGFILEYIGLLGVILGNTGVISKDSGAYSGGAMIEIVGMIIILVFTFKLCKLLEFSLIKNLLLSVINVSIGINIIATLPYLLFKSSKIKDTIKPDDFHNKEDLSSSQNQKAGGYIGGIILFICYATLMLRKQNFDDISPLAYFTGNILELIGLIPLFMVYLALRKRIIIKKWFVSKKWLASLIAGLVSLFLLSNVIVFVEIILSRIK